MKVIGIPPFLLPAKLESMMSMNTIPDAPSNAEVGKSTNCNMPDTIAVIRIPLRSVRQRWSDNKEEEHIVYKVIPTAVAKDMTEQPDIE